MKNNDIGASLNHLMEHYFIDYKGYRAEILPDDHVLFDRKCYSKKDWKCYVDDLIEAKQKALNNSIGRPKQ